MATERTTVSAKDFAAGMFELDGAAEFYNIMIHGDSGCGKTVLAGSAPGRKLFLAGEPGYISAARLGAQGKGRLIPDTATATAAASWLENGNARRFDWLVVDGCSTMQNKFLLGYTAEAFDKNPASRAHRNLPDRPDYLNAQNFMKSWIGRLIDLPINVLFTTHSMRPEGDDGEQLVYPFFQGKGYEVSNYISGLMHCVGYMAPRVVKKGGSVQQVRRILWQHYRDPKSETTYFAKDQLDALGRYTDDATLPDLIAMIEARNAGLKSSTPRKARKTTNS